MKRRAESCAAPTEGCVDKMRVRDAVKSVKEGKLPATVILYGESAYIRSTGVRELTTAAGVSVPELNLMTYEGRPSMDSLRDALSKPPFMSENKVVVLRRTDLFGPGASADLSRPMEQMIIEDHTLFIVDAGEKIDKRKASVKHLLKTAMLIECAPLTGDALSGYIAALARQRRLHISKTSAESLAERCSGDLHVVAAELDKLKCVCRGEITQADLDRYSRPVPEAGVFAIQDLFLGGRCEEAKRAVDAMLRTESSPMGFLSMTADALRQMLIARTCRDARFPYQKTVGLITSETGARDWVARRAYDRSAHLSADKLRYGLRRLSEVDFGIKQGRYNPGTDLYALLYDIYAT